jgi:hypothetical protein
MIIVSLDLLTSTDGWAKYHKCRSVRDYLQLIEGRQRKQLRIASFDLWREHILQASTKLRLSHHRLHTLGIAFQFGIEVLSILEEQGAACRCMQIPRLGLELIERVTQTCNISSRCREITRNIRACEA